jgi:Transcriptional regulatory protein, C terminal
VQNPPARRPAAWSSGGSSGTLLALYPVNGGSARMAIVGYLLPREPVVRPAGAIRPVTAIHPGRSSPAPSPAPASAPHAPVLPVPAAVLPARAPLGVGGLVLDTAGRRAMVGGRDAGLVYLEFELLQFLMANAGRALTRAEIFRSVWGAEPGEATRTVDIHVHRIRRKLGPEHGRHLVTLRRIGYRYEVPAAD